MGTVKNFVIDTNIILFDPEAIFKLQDNNVIIPDVVLEELDHFKTEQTDRGHNSRVISKYLDELKDKGSFIKGVSLGKGLGLLRIVFTNDLESKKNKYDLNKYDNKILALCEKLSKEEKLKNVILITKDVLLRVKAKTLNIVAQDYLNDKVVKKGSEYYMGRRKIYLSSKIINKFKSNKKLSIENLNCLNNDGLKVKEPLEINEFLEIYHSDTNNKSAVLGRYDGKNIVPLQYSNGLKNVQPRNIGQHFMLECLMQPPDIAPLVIIKGIAGTAKTFFAVAAGLENYTTKEKYNGILICRPAVCMDEEIGYLPGDEKAKIAPYMRAIKDNVFALNNCKKGNSENKIMGVREFAEANQEVERLFEDDIIKTEALAYIRGRSINNYWVIFDEMQNSTKRQIKGIITRGGLGSKMIVIGDPDQIDSPYLDKQSNGLTYASEKMRGSSLCWQVTMLDSECERSPLALESAKRL